MVFNIVKVEWIVFLRFLWKEKKIDYFVRIVRFVFMLTNKREIIYKKYFDFFKHKLFMVLRIILHPIMLIFSLTNQKI